MAEWQPGLLILSLKQSCKVVDVFKPANFISSLSQYTPTGYVLCWSSFPGLVAIVPEHLQKQLPSQPSVSKKCCYLHFRPGKQGAGRLNDLFKVMQDMLEFQIAHISLDEPSFTLAALYIVSPSHSQLSESYKDREQGMHERKWLCSRGRGLTLTDIWTAKSN